MTERIHAGNARSRRRRVLAWLRWKVGHHLARACWKLYDLSLHVEKAGNRLNHWAYK